MSNTTCVTKKDIIKKKEWVHPDSIVHHLYYTMHTYRSSTLDTSKVFGSLVFYGEVRIHSKEQAQRILDIVQKYIDSVDE